MKLDILTETILTSVKAHFAAGEVTPDDLRDLNLVIQQLELQYEQAKIMRWYGAPIKAQIMKLEEFRELVKAMVEE